jgi:hypothetical protein
VRKKNGSDYAENVRRCHTKYGCVGTQVPLIFAPLVENMQMIYEIITFERKRQS